MINALAITSKGLEEIAALEIRELIKPKTEAKECAVLFSPKNLIDLCLLCYKSQSVSRIVFLFDSFEFKNNFFKLLDEKINKQNFEKWIDKDTTFAVKCCRFGDHPFLSSEVERKTGSYIIKNIIKNKKLNLKVNLEKPDILFYVYVCNNMCYFGIDFCGFDLSKREYRIFTHPQSLKGSIAYYLVRIADYKKEETLLDPFCTSGEIAIEAALFKTKFPINYYRKEKLAFLKLKPFKKTNFKDVFKKEDHKIKETEKAKIFGLNSILRYVSSSQKNAKIAGINKHIIFSKISLEWLDTKFDKNQVDKIVTQLPSYSQKTNKGKIDGIHKEFFYQAEHILKNNGKIVLLLRTEINNEIPAKYNFKLSEKKEIFSGKQKHNVLIYKKQKP